MRCWVRRLSYKAQSELMKKTTDEKSSEEGQDPLEVRMQTEFGGESSSG